MRIRRILVRGALVIVSAAIATKGADLFVGWYDPAGVSHFTHKNRHDAHILRTEAVTPMWSLAVAVPDSEIQAGVHYRINDLGFRGRDYTREKQDGVFRIVLLGDSVTYGWGVEQADCFAEQLERRLSARDPSRPVEVLNLAVPGYETTHQLYSWQRLGKTLQPDLVVVIFNQNDVQLIPDELLQLAELEAARHKDASWIRRIGTHVLRESPWNEWFRATLPNLRNLALFHFLFHTTQSDEEALTEKFTEMKDGIRNSIQFLAQLKKKVEDTGARFALCDLQHFLAIESGCSAEGIMYRSIAYAGYLSDMSLRNSPSDPHPNAAGHARIADRLLWALDDMGLVPPEKP